MRKMTKEIHDKIKGEIFKREVAKQEDVRKGYYWKTRAVHEEALSSYLQGILHAGFKEEQINPIIDEAKKDCNRHYGLKD